MEKSLSKKDKEKVEKYISLDEMNFLKKHYRKIPDTYWERVEPLYDMLKIYFESFSIDHRILAVIILEMQSFYTHYERLRYKAKVTVPVMNSGATGLIDALDLFNSNFLNIESVRITVRGSNPLDSDFTPNTLDELKLKDVLPGTFIIKGKEVLIELFRILNEKRQVFNELAQTEQKYMESKYLKLKKKKPKSYLRKIYSKILYHYLKDHLPKFSDSKIYLIGGMIFEIIGIMPIPRKNVSEERRFKNFAISNFKKSLFEKINK